MNMISQLPAISRADAAREAERISALLGPDGEPLMVAYPRPRLGFDLSPRIRT